MLIVHVILLIAVLCCTSSSVISIDTSASSTTSTKLKRGIIDLGHDIRNNQEQFGGTQSTPRNSPPQDINSRLLPHYRTAKALDTRKVPYTKANQRTGSHAYGNVPKRPFSYTSAPTHQQAELYQNSPLAPYFNALNNPSTYKTATNNERPLEGSKSITSQTLQKVQTSVSPNYNAFLQDKIVELSGFPDFEYPSFPDIDKIMSQSLQSGASSPTVQVPVYKASYPSPKITKYANIYAPSFSASNGNAFRSPDKRKPNAKQNNEVTVDVNGEKISVPIIQLQTNPDLSEISPVFDNQQFLLSANYPLESDFSFDFSGEPKLNVKNASPFLSPLSSFQGQVVPIQTVSGNPQFPQYKGASIEVYSVPTSVPKVQGNYESLYNQPQLHFGKEHGGQFTDAQRNTLQTSTSVEDILEDVEIINKKNPQPHPSQSDSEEEEEEVETEERDERYKSSAKENEDSSENNDDDDDDDERELGKYFKEPPSESDFKPSTSFPFKEYDEKFGKHAAQVDDEDSEDKSYSGYKNYPTSDDDEDENEEEPSSGYRAEYVDSPKSQGSYEVDEEEEESRKYEKREKTDEGSYEVEPKHSKYYGMDFEQEFEESYREELPKHRYVHVKEVPDIDSHNNPKTPKRQSKNNNRARVNRERSEEPKSQESRVSRKNRKIPKAGYKDSAARSSDVSAKKASKVIYEEIFGYKKPVTGKYPEHARSETTLERYPPAKKLTGQDSYLRASKYHKSKNPKVSGERTAKNKYSHSRPISASRNRKLEMRSKDSPEESVSRSSARQLSNSGDRASLYEPSVVSGQTRSLTNKEILRDLTGI